MPRPDRRIKRGDLRARITGYRDVDGDWNLRNPRNGHWYKSEDGRHPGKPPNEADLAQTPHVNIEMDLGGDVYHFDAPGPIDEDRSFRQLVIDFIDQVVDGDYGS